MIYNSAIWESTKTDYDTAVLFVDALATDRGGDNFENIIIKLIIYNDLKDISCEIFLM